MLKTTVHATQEKLPIQLSLTQPEYTDTRPTSPSADPTIPGTWQGSPWITNFEVGGIYPCQKQESNPGLLLSRQTPYPLGQVDPGSSDPTLGLQGVSGSLVSMLKLCVASSSNANIAETQIQISLSISLH